MLEMFHIAGVSNKYLPVDGDEQYAITGTSKGKQAKCGHKNTSIECLTEVDIKKKFRGYYLVFTTIPK